MALNKDRIIQIGKIAIEQIKNNEAMGINEKARSMQTVVDWARSHFATEQKPTEQQPTQINIDLDVYLPADDLETQTTIERDDDGFISKTTRVTKPSKG